MDEAEGTTALKTANASLSAYLQVLWAAAPPLLAVERLQQADRTPPFLTRAGLHLPASVALASREGHDWYRAAAAHAAAHRTFSHHVFVRTGIAPITQALIDLLEDARVEALAWRVWPGLRRLWARHHSVVPLDGDDFETLLLRLARALIDADYDDPHPWVCKGRSSFYPAGSVVPALDAVTEPLRLRRMASTLGHDIGQMRLGFNARSYRLGPSYRDDNRWLWHRDEQEQRGRPQATSLQTGKQASDATTPDCSLPEQTWTYPEWDRRIGRLRPRWCTVTEQLAPALHSVEGVKPDGSVHAALVALLRRLAANERVLHRREREGDQIDLDAAVQRAASVRQQGACDPRIHQRPQRAPRSAAAFLLLDISTSSADVVDRTAATVSALALQKQAAAQLALSMLAAGWRVAVVGFCSNGRHRVALQRVLDFGEVWDASAAQRLAELEPAWSTRMGAALRHATDRLLRETAALRIVVALGDGEPHDVNVHEPRYLADDAHAAVQAAKAQGVRSLCLLSSNATAVAARRTFNAASCFVMPYGHVTTGILAAFQRQA